MKSRKVQDKWNRGELNPVAVFARHSSDPSAIPLSDSDLGGNRTHTPRGSRLSTDPVYQLQHEIISAARGAHIHPSSLGGSRTLTPEGTASETAVYSNSTTKP